MYLKAFKFLIFSICLLFVFNSFSQDTIILQPGSFEGKDAIIHGLDTCMNLNFGNNEQIPACAWTFGGVPGIVRGIIEFDLSSISTSTEIISAKLSLSAWDKYNHMGQHSMLSGSNTCEIRRVISPWEEMSVTWNNQPNTTAQNQVLIPETNNPNQNFPDLDVTNLVIDMVNNPDNSHGFLIKLETEEHYRRMNFCSSDHENSELHPKLEIIIGCEYTIADFSTNINDLIVQFNDQSQNANNWYWDFGDGSFSTQHNPMHEYSSAGTYNVCLISSNSCSADTICKSISVCNNAVSNFDYETNIKTVNFTDISTNPTSWYWDFGDGRTSNEQNPSHEYSSYGKYNVCLTVENSCSTDIFCDSVFVYKNVEANYVYYLGENAVYFVDSSLYANSWFWDFGDGNYSIEQNPSHQFQDYGTYYVCLTASNPSSTDIFCDSVFYIPESDNLNLIEVYPNPPSTNLTITNPTNLNKITIQIYTLYGEKMYDKELDFNHNSTYEIDLSDLPTAQYFLKMINGNKSDTRKIFIVK